MRDANICLHKKTSVILFPGIKCHDVSSFTCLTCTLVFFVPILGLPLTHLAVCLSLPSLSKHTHPLISVSSPTTSTVSVYVSTRLYPHPHSSPHTHRECCLSVPITSMHFVCHAWKKNPKKKTTKSHATGMIFKKNKNKKKCMGVKVCLDVFVCAQLPCAWACRCLCAPEFAGLPVRS